MPKPYPPEFRRRALDLVASGRTVVEVAELLGIAQARGPRRAGESMLKWGDGEVHGDFRSPGDASRMSRSPSTHGPNTRTWCAAQADPDQVVTHRPGEMRLGDPEPPGSVDDLREL